MRQNYSTSQIAKIADVHPNTVRNYEKWKLILPVPRKPNGYRQFSEIHLTQVLLIKDSFKSTWIEGEIRSTALEIVDLVSKLEVKYALHAAYKHLNLLEAELQIAKKTLIVLERYAKKDKDNLDSNTYTTKDTADKLGISIHMLYDWERNGLLSIKRNSDNGYREYSVDDLNRLKIIILLRRANYSLMSILNMLSHLDKGRKDNFEALVKQEHTDNIFFATDTWISTLEELIQTSKEMINNINKLKKLTEDHY